MTDNITLQYPNMRDELIYCLKTFSDHEYQWTAWVRGEYPPEVDFDNLDEALHFLYDDTRLAQGAELCVGVFLKNQEEADAVDNLLEAIDTVFEKYDYGLKDEEYIQKPEWQEVLTAAKAAFDLIKAR